VPGFAAAPAPPACPSGLILWIPVAWYPEKLYLLRHDDLSEPQKLRRFEERDLPDAWRLGTDEWVLLRAKLRPAVVVSSEAEHQARGSVRLMPLYKITDDNSYYERNEALIRAGDIPGLFWIDDVPVHGAPESQVVDCARVVRFPRALLDSRANSDRIAVMDPLLLLALKQFWSESILL
jgi:hypothetical protein